MLGPLDEGGVIMDTYWHQLAERTRMQQMQRGMLDHFELARLARAMAPKQCHAEGLVRRRRRAAGQRIVLLGRRYPHTYLTEREAHCALLLLRGCTAREAAKQMHLSSRTVEYYISNIKSKLGLRKKSGVVAALLDSDFIVNLRCMMLGAEGDLVGDMDPG